MRRIALEVAVQAPLALGHRKFVVGLGEVVHADENVAGVGQAADRQLQDLQARIGRRQVGLVDAPLRLGEAGQVGVVVDREAVRVELDDLVERMVETDHVLLRQAVDQVHRNALEAKLAGRVDHQLGFFEALHAIDGDLHFRRKILDADAHAVEAQFAEEADVVAVDLARIDLDRILAAGQQAKMLADDFHQPLHLVVAEEGRRAAAEMQLDHVAAAFQRRLLHGNFLAQVLDVLGGAAVILGDDLVAGAVVADRVAERYVDV
jgi:hypothetical protein